MWRANISNRAFDRMGERYSRLIDPYHFLGMSAFDIPRKKKDLPPVNIIVKDDTIFEMEVAVPGYTREELEIVVADDVLRIRGEKSRREASESDKYVLEEFDLDRFERSFRLMPGIGKEKITARCENGMLYLTFIDVPREEELATKKVKVG